MEIRIFYHDTDAGGVVYYANYLKYLEEARTEFLEQRGLSVETFRQNNLIYAVRKCLIHYRSPARYGDILIFDTQLIRVTAAQLFFNQKIFLKQSNRLIVESEVVLVCLDKNFKPVQIPGDLKQLLITN